MVPMAFRTLALLGLRPPRSAPSRTTPWKVGTARQSGPGASTNPGGFGHLTPRWLSNLRARPLLCWGSQLVALCGCPRCPQGRGRPYTWGQGLRERPGRPAGAAGWEVQPPWASWKRRNLEAGKAFPPCPQMSGAFVSRTFQKILMLQLRHSERRVSPGPVGAVTAHGKDHIAGMLRGVERTRMPTSWGKLLGDWVGWAHTAAAPPSQAQGPRVLGFPLLTVGACFPRAERKGPSQDGL